MPVSGGALKLKVKVNNLAPMLRSLQAVGLELTDVDMTPLGRLGARLVAHYAPVRTGRLAGTTRAAKPGKNRIAVRSGSNRVPYAAPINYGWKVRNIDKSLYMQRASDVLDRLAPAMMQRQVDRAIAARGLAP